MTKLPTTVDALYEAIQVIAEEVTPRRPVGLARVFAAGLRDERIIEIRHVGDDTGGAEIGIDLRGRLLTRPLGHRGPGFHITQPFELRSLVVGVTDGRYSLEPPAREIAEGTPR